MVTDDLRTRAKMLASDMRLASNALEQKNRTRKAKEEAATTVWAGMNFRERHLKGWFGGNRKRVRHYENLKIDIRTLSDRIDQLEHERANFDKMIGLVIHSELMKSDEVFRQIREVYFETSNMKSVIDKFVTALHSAIDEADDEYSAEFADIVAADKRFSLLNYMETDVYNAAIRAAAQILPVFQEKLGEYNEFISNFDSPDLGEIDGSIELAFDSALEGFDFKGIFEPYSLDDAGTALRVALHRVEMADDIVTENLRKADAVNRAYLTRAREAALA